MAWPQSVLNRITDGEDAFTKFTLGSSGTAFESLFIVTATIDLGSVAANTSEEEAVTVTGVAASDFVVAVEKPSLEAGLVLGGARVSGTDEVTLTVGNVTGSPIDASSEASWRFLILRPAS